MASQPKDQPVTPLRQRMLDDMAMRAMGSRTQHDYVVSISVKLKFRFGTQEQVDLDVAFPDHPGRLPFMQEVKPKNRLVPAG